MSARAGCALRAGALVVLAVPGLVSIADVAPTAVDLGRGRAPGITSREMTTSVDSRLADLDRRLQRAHDTRTAGTIILVASTLALAGLGLLLRSRILTRAGLLAIPAALAASLALSVAGVTRPGVVTEALAVATVGGAVLGALRRGLLLPLLGIFL